MATAEGVFPKVGGDPPYASEFNNLAFDIVYSGNGFDSNNSVTLGSHELNFIAPSRCGSSNYAVIDITGEMNGRPTAAAGNAIATYLMIQTKESGGTYANSLGSTIFHKIEDVASNTNSDPRNAHTFTWVHALTGSEKSQGMYIMLYSKSQLFGTAINVGWQNKMSTVRLSG